MELEVTWGRTARIWWAFMWRALIATICVTVVAGIIGGALGAIVFLMGVDEGTMVVAGTIVGFAMGLLSQLVVMRMILNRDYGEFRLSLVPNSPVTVAPDLADSP